MSDAKPTRGRPRNADVDAAIRVATLEQLAEVGYAELTIEAVATRAEVSRPTIYRRFPTKATLIAAVLTDALATANPEVPDSGDVNADTRTLLGNTVRALSDTAFGAAMAELIGPAARDSDLAQTLGVFLAQRRELMHSLLTRAERQQLLRVDVDTGIDLLLGAIYFRHLITHQPLSPEFVADVVDAVVAPPGS